MSSPVVKRAVPTSLPHAARWTLTSAPTALSSMPRSTAAHASGVGSNASTRAPRRAAIIV